LQYKLYFDARKISYYERKSAKNKLEKKFAVFHPFTSQFFLLFCAPYYSQSIPDLRKSVAADKTGLCQRVDFA